MRNIMVRGVTHKLSPLVQMDGIYRRAGSLNHVGDSLTDIAALSPLLTKYSKKHISKCQEPSGRMLRHPDRLDTCTKCHGDIVNKYGERTRCDDHCDFSRDHVVSLCFYSLWTNDPEHARKFLWYIIPRFGKFGSGSMGQSMINLPALAALMLAAKIPLIGDILYLICLIYFYISSAYTTVGYRLILNAEHALIMERFTGIPKFLVQPIYWNCYRRQKSNLFYEFLYYGQLTTLGEKRLWNYWDNWKSQYGTKGWLWTDPSDGRKGTGADIAYLLWLNGNVIR